MRVLIFEGDKIEACSIAMMLMASGIVVDNVGTGEAALNLTKAREYDAVILDLVLPDLEGYEVIRLMRVAGIDTPIIIISGLNGPQAKIKGLGLGADDYLVKPYDKDELIARLRVMVRRNRNYTQSVITVGSLTLDLQKREFAVDGKVQEFTTREFAIVELLMLRSGTTLTKDAFLDHIYPGMNKPDKKIIDVFICKVRKKFAALGAGDMIMTIWGEGYMLNGPKLVESPIPVIKAELVDRQLTSAAW